MINSATTQPTGTSFVCAANDPESKQDPSVLWKKAQANSSFYFEKLGLIDLTPAELEIVKKNAPPGYTGELPSSSNRENHGFLFVTIKNKEFRLVLESVSGHSYGEKWKDLIMVFCTNDSSLNISAGGGSNLINIVADEWHELILGKLQNDLILDFKKRISAVDSRNIRLWKQVQQHSEEICTRLGVTHAELPVIKSCLESKKMSESKSFFDNEQGEFHFSFGGKSFKLDIHSTFGPHSGGGSKNLIQVVCTDDASINESMGVVTTFVNIITEKWHSLLLDGSQNAILDDLKLRISEGSSRNIRLWKQLQVRSEEICQSLGIQKRTDLKVMRSFLSKRLDMKPGRMAELNGVFHITIKDKVFELRASNICGLYYGGQWTNLISVVCLCTPSLNERTGGGTSLVNIINEQWHQLLLKVLETPVVDQCETKSQTLLASGQE